MRRLGTFRSIYGAIPNCSLLQTAKMRSTAVLLLLLFGAFIPMAMGQTVTISSTAANPTQSNPVPLKIEFSEAVNYFDAGDIIISGGNIINFEVQTPAFGYEANLGRMFEFDVNPFNPDPAAAKVAVLAIDFSETGRIFALTMNDGVYAYHTDGSTTTRTRIIAGEEFSEPRDIAVHNGMIYIADTGNNRIVVYNISTSSIAYMGENMASEPSGVEVDDFGDVYIADAGNDRIIVLRSTGELIRTITGGSGSQALNYPVRVALDRDGNVFVNDSGNRRVQIFDTTGQYLRTISAARGDDIGTPGSIVADEYGFLYIADLGDTDFQALLNFEISALAGLLSGSRVQVFEWKDDGFAPISIEEEINIPVDLALKPCGYLAVNNGDASGFYPVEVKFDAKTYRILPTSFTADLSIDQECLTATIDVPAAVVKTATCGNNTAANTFKILWDETKPLITKCLADREETLSGGEFILPKYYEAPGFTASDNCGDVQYEQTPAAGQAISSNTPVSIVARDAAGNLSDPCEFMVNVSEASEEPLEFTSCPSAFTLELAENCQAPLPDFTEQVATNREAAFTQEPPAGTLIWEDTQVVLTATDANGETAECKVDVNLEDNIIPEVSCPTEPIEVRFDPEEGYVVPDYAAQFTIIENCEYEVLQNPAPGEVIYESQYIDFIVIDNGGNESLCYFALVLVEDEVLELSCPADKTVSLDDNCSFIMPDYRKEGNASLPGAEISQSPAPGEIVYETTAVTLTATLDEQTANCSFQVIVEDNLPPTAICISAYTFKLGPDGTGAVAATVLDAGSTDNCGIVEWSLSKENFTTADIGQNTVTFTVKDAAGNEDSCETVITVERYEGSGPQLPCPQPTTLSLDQNGERRVSVYYPGDAEVEFELDRDFFTCEDIGTHTIKITYTGDFTGSCFATVTIVDAMPPQVECAQNFSLILDANGNAELTAADLDIEATDNCGIGEVVLSKTKFTVADLGEQTVTVTARDTSGNESICETTVTVRPNEDASYLIIYPNPGKGLVYAKAMAGVNITRAEIFDMRGRFLFSKDFSGEELYVARAIDLRGYRSGVYPIIYYTEDRKFIRRAIINHD